MLINAFRALIHQHKREAIAKNAGTFTSKRVKNPLWPWVSQENLRKTVKPRSPELASIEACWTRHVWEEKAGCHGATCFQICRIQRFFLQSNNVLYSLTSDVLVLVALILAITWTFFLFVCPKTDENNAWVSWVSYPVCTHSKRMAKRDYHIQVYGSPECHPSDAQW